MRMPAFCSSWTFVAKDCKLSYNMYIFCGLLFGWRVTMPYKPNGIIYLVVYMQKKTFIGGGGACVFLAAFACARMGVEVFLL